MFYDVNSNNVNHQKKKKKKSTSDCSLFESIK